MGVWLIIKLINLRKEKASVIQAEVVDKVPWTDKPRFPFDQVIFGKLKSSYRITEDGLVDEISSSKVIKWDTIMSRAMLGGKPTAPISRTKEPCVKVANICSTLTM